MDPRRVTLTFDNGPSPHVTSDVLDVLAANDALATFFVVGSQLERPGARDLVTRAHDDGHWIGNHSMTHKVSLGDDVDPDAPEREIEGAQALLGDLAHRDRLFRPFGGGGVLDRHLLSRAALDHLERGSYTVVLWNCVPRDWERPTTWADVALAEIEQRPWTVLVLHDLPTGAMDALPSFLARLRDTGVTVTQELPESCVPVRRGERVGAIDDYVTG